MAYMIRKWMHGRWYYSGGGTSPSWREKRQSGKVWKDLGQLKNHLAQFVSHRGENRVPEEWEAIVVELVERPDSQQNARDLAELHAVLKRERHEEIQAFKEQQERAALKRLLDKYGQ